MCFESFISCSISSLFSFLRGTSQFTTPDSISEFFNSFSVQIITNLNGNVE